MVEIQKVSKGKTVYNQGEETNGIYIIQSGMAEAYSVLDMDSFRQYPVGISQWEIERTTNSVL